MKERGFSGRVIAVRAEAIRCILSLSATISIVLLLGAPVAYSQLGTRSPHLDPEHGVARVDDPTNPRGSCSQCHLMKGPETGPPYPGVLFEENSNQLCYTAGGACHSLRPVNYPADENSRIPAGFPDAGYFEYNSGGSKIHGVEYRNRWPGEAVYENTADRKSVV